MLNVPLPTPGKDRVLFAIENCILSVEVPPKEGLPHADVWIFYTILTLSFSFIAFHMIQKIIWLPMKMFILLRSDDVITIFSFYFMQISFQPLVQCLDVDNLIRLFTAVLLERRILLRSNKYTSDLDILASRCFPFQWTSVRHDWASFQYFYLSPLLHLFDWFIHPINSNDKIKDVIGSRSIVEPREPCMVDLMLYTA